MEHGDASPQPAHWSWALTLLWGLFVAFLFVVLQTFVALVVVILRGNNLTEETLEQALLAAEEDGFLISVATFFTTVICTSLVIGIIKLKGHTVLKDYLGLRPVAGKTLLKWIGVLVVFVALSDSLTIALGRPVTPEFMLSTYSSAQPLWMFWLALVVCAPLFEEIFFRGFLHKGLAGSFLRPAGAIIATAILWALIHLQYDFYGMATIGVAGLLLGTARVHTGSLLTPMLLHALMNVVATSQAAYAVAG